MTLKFKDVPKMLSIKEADRLRARYDPYKIVKAIFEREDYDGIACILLEQKNPRHVAAIPTLLIHKKENYAQWYEEMSKREVLNEFLYCIKIAKSIANEFHDNFSSELEGIVNNLTTISSSLNDFCYAEFKAFYERYRRYGLG